MSISFPGCFGFVFEHQGKETTLTGLWADLVSFYPILFYVHPDDTCAIGLRLFATVPH